MGSPAHPFILGFLQPLAPILAHPERLERITVCTRPFRAAGPRIEPETLGPKTLIHNYGHGGSGWSLSWGSAARVLPLAMQALAGRREVAVIGCGALGLTAATVLRESGLRVTLYARERPPQVRSSHATGAWTPDSRIALPSGASNRFAMEWEQMARHSWARYGRMLTLPGSPVEFTDRFLLSDILPDQEVSRRIAQDPIGFLHLDHLLADLYPAHQDLGPGEHPFPTKHARHTRQLQFNIAGYSQLLIDELLRCGAAIEQADFHAPSDLLALPQTVIVNCTGYGARALFSDDSITPIRGQIGWLPVQADAFYGVFWASLNLLARRDGIVVQSSPQGEASGWNDSSEAPDPQETHDALALVSRLFR